MRRFAVLDWLDDVTDGPVGRVVKAVVGLLILASVLRGCYGVVQDVRHEKAPLPLRGTQQKQGKASARLGSSTCAVG